MKRNHRFALSSRWQVVPPRTASWRSAILLALIGLWVNTSAQEFSMEVFSFGGAGVCAGGDFELSATLGQPDAAPAAGAGFDLTGGFWSVVTAMEATAGPRLEIALVGTTLSFSWPEEAGLGMHLEEAPTLTGAGGIAAWSAISAPTSTNNGIVRMDLPLASGNRFYRLR